MDKNLNQETRKNIRTDWFDYLMEFSSIKLQRYLWFPNEKKLISSYIELMNGYFDDILDGDDYSKVIELGYISEEEYKVIEPFHLGLLQYNEPSNDLIEILADPNWIQLCGIAKSCFDKLKQNLSDDEDMKIIRELEKEVSYIVLCQVRFTQSV